MKTTMDLPEDLVTEIKLKAVREKKKMKDVAAEALRAGLNEPDSGESENEKAKVRRRRLAALHSIEKPTEKEHQALMDYLIEYREDRETFFNRD